MSARRFFVEGVHEVGETVTLDGTDAHKIRSVLRLRSGDDVEIVDSAATVFAAAAMLEGSRVCAQLREKRIAPAASGPHIVVAQALPKGQKMDFVVEKLTELGVAAIVPFESERTIVTGIGAGKLERWRRIAKSAAQQSGRSDVARVEEPVRFERLLDMFGNFDGVLFPWELAEQVPLRVTLPVLIAGARRLLIVIGPEGGFTHAEAELARKAGASLVSLGTRILRTETAAMTVVAIVKYLLEE